MPLHRQAQAGPRLRGAVAAAAIGAGAATCSAAALSLMSPPGPSARLIAAGGQSSIPILIALVAGSILWAFGAAALAVVRSRWSPIVAAATIGAGAIGITAGAPLLFGQFGVLAIAGAAAVLGGVILIGAGILARGLAGAS